MRLLLDTHALLWWFGNDCRLPDTARSAIADPKNQLFVSACAAYEMRYKQSRHRLPPFPGDLRDALRRDRIAVLSISMAHALAAAEFPGPHRDPWDRIMMAQALAEECQMVTVDPVFAAYGVAVLW